MKAVIILLNRPWRHGSKLLKVLLGILVHQLCTHSVSEFNLETNYEYNLTMKWIYAADRRLNESIIYDTMVTAVELRNIYPNEVVGYDLVDEEV